MHALDLLDNLVEFLEKNLQDYLLKTKDGGEKAPAVYDGYLPPKNNKRRSEGDLDEEDHPFIIVRYLGEKDDIKSENTADYKILFGIYNEDAQRGYRDALGLMIRVKTLLKENQAIGSGILTGEIESALFELQSKPMYHGVMELSFNIPQILLKHKEGMPDGYY